MKKKILILFVCLFLLTGCVSKEKERNKVMGTYAKDYYKKFAYDNGIDIPRVEIKNLKAANEQLNAGYDLKRLETCTDSSYVDLKLDENKEVKEIIYRLNCK